MTQLFRDQCREVHRGKSGWRWFRFWGWMLADTGVAAGREHLCAIGKKMKLNTLECWYRRLPTFRQMFVSIVIIGLTLTILSATLSPTRYSSRVRVAMTKTDREIPGSEQLLPSLVNSERVLQSVATALNLGRARANHTGSLKPKETPASLRRRVDVRRFRNTSLFEVKVFDEDRDEAAAIANMIAETCRRATRFADNPSLTEVEVVDMAEPGLRPVRPNKPLIWVVGVFSTFLAATGLALLRKVSQSLRRSRASRIATAY